MFDFIRGRFSHQFSSFRRQWCRQQTLPFTDVLSPDRVEALLEEEGIEFHPDSWERFERTVDKVIKAPPVHRTGKTTAGDQPKRRGRVADKTSG